jgi:peptidoglycan/xylan/chitin deacetylase (PgdA/CDA1 family)
MSASDWTATDCTLTDNTTEYLSGNQSIKVTPTGTPASWSMEKVVSLDLSNYSGYLRLLLYAHSSIVPNVNLTLSSVADYAKNYNRTTEAYKAGWNAVNFPLANWTLVGAESWANTMIRLKFTFTPRNGGEAGIVSLDRLEGAVNPRNAVVLTFDDAHTSVYSEAFAYMQTKNILGTVYHVSDWIDTAGYLTAAQLLEMHNAGWTVGNHTKDHAAFSTLSQAQQEAEVTNCKNALQAIGITGNGPLHVAYPGGAHTAVTPAAMQAAGILTGRMLEPLRHSVLPYPDMYQIECSNIGLPAATTNSLSAAPDS